MAFLTPRINVIQVPTLSALNSSPPVPPNADTSITAIPLVPASTSTVVSAPANLLTPPHVSPIGEQPSQSSNQQCSTMNYSSDSHISSATPIPVVTVAHEDDDDIVDDTAGVPNPISSPSPPSGHHNNPYTAIFNPITLG